jgi:hypothetical protein
MTTPPQINNKSPNDRLLPVSGEKGDWVNEKNREDNFKRIYFYNIIP